MTLELYKGKVVCPRCDGNGLVYKLKYSNHIFYICDECEAAWEDSNIISSDTFTDLDTLLEQKGFRYQDRIVNKGDYYWYNPC